MRSLLASLIAVLALSFPTKAQAQLNPTSEECEAAWSSIEAYPSPVALYGFLQAFAACPQIDLAAQMLEAVSHVGSEDRDETRSQDLGWNIRSNMPSDYLATGRQVVRGESMTAVGGGYGVLLLRRVGSRNRLACEVFLDAVDFTQNTLGQPRIVEGTFVLDRPVYWPVLTPVAANSRSDCAGMISQYDFERSQVLLRRISERSGRTIGDGPILAVWRTDGSSAGVFDFSNVPADEFDDQLDAALTYLTRASDIWDPRLYEAASFRQRMRRLLVEEAAPASYVIASLLSFPTAANAAEQ